VRYPVGMSVDPDPPAGLRERKRLVAMRRIQEVALDLFDDQGYAAVTIEQIAQASDVSPSSVYRYFGTKEQIVLWDEFDPILLERMARELPGTLPLEAARRVLDAMVDHLAAGGEEHLQRRLRHAMSDPALESAAAGHAYALSETLGALLASGVGRPPEDLELQVFSHALVGGLLGGLHHWHGSGFARPLREVFRDCFVIFEEGLDVVAVPGPGA